LQNVTFKDSKIGRKDEMVQILMSNEGYRSIIISRVYYRCNNNGCGDCGIYDELKHPYGVADIVLPVEIKRGKTFEYNFLRKDALKNISEISVIDSKNKVFRITQKEINCFNNTGSCLSVLMPIKYPANKNILKKFKNFLCKKL